MALAESLASPDPRLEALARARQRSTPVTFAAERALPVLSALEPLLPDGLRRGATVVVDGGPGATALAVALGAAATQAGSWAAVVGHPSLGLQAAAELGITLERLVVVPDVPQAQWATVVAALLDGVDVVLARPPSATVSAADARRLAARARERQAVLVPLPRRPGGRPSWPQGPDVRLTVGPGEWSAPHRRLEGRRAEVVTGGKGAAARIRRATLWLPGPDGGVQPA